MKLEATTRDALHGGALSLEQPKDGYRVNVDAVHLAAFAISAREHPVRRACDLGAGVGAVGLSLLHLGGASHVTLVEKDAFTASLAEKNARENGFGDRATIVCNDVTAFADEAPACADLVVMNPPYFREGAARAPRHARSKGARVGSLETFTSAARAISRRRARVCLVYPAHDLSTVVELLRTCGLEPKRAQFVHSRKGAPARIALVEAQPARRGGLVVMPPLIERTETADLGLYSRS